MIINKKEFLSHSLFLWGGKRRNPRLDQREVVDKVMQFLKILGKALLNYLFIKRQFSRAILSSNFRKLDF